MDQVNGASESLAPQLCSGLAQVVRRAIGLVTALLLLAACAQGPAPGTSPAEPASPPSAEHREGRATARETPQRFVRRWQAEALAAQQSGSTTTYRGLGPQCQPCTDFADQVDAIYAAGGRIDLRRLRVEKVVDIDGANRFRLTRVLGRTRVLDADGREQQSFGGGREVLVVLLDEVGQEWRVDNFFRVRAG